MRSQHGVGDQSAKMIKKLHDNSLKLEQFYSNMFTGLKMSFSVSSVVVCCYACRVSSHCSMTKGI